MRQWHCYVGGQRYGPVADDVLREWAASGRLRPTDNVWTEGMANWAPASTVGGLFASAAAAMQAATGFNYARPHRGGTVLALGIIGMVVELCCIIGLVLSIIAWVMGAGDLKEMAAGRMDRSGEGMTRAGMICGIIGVVLGVLSTVVGLAYYFMVVMAGM